MTEARLDAFAVALARAQTRRAMIAALAGAIVAGERSASAGQPSTESTCRGKGTKCRRDGQCCSGRCRQPHGKHKKTRKGKCRCSPYLKPCQKDGDCCSLDGTPLVCASGKCQT
jgi:hypothetical protein